MRSTSHTLNQCISHSVHVCNPLLLHDIPSCLLLPTPYWPHYTTLGPLSGKSVSKAVDAAQLLNLTEKDGKRNALAAVVTAKREVLSPCLCAAHQVNSLCCVLKDSYLQCSYCVCVISVITIINFFLLPSFLLFSHFSPVISFPFSSPLFYHFLLSSLISSSLLLLISPLLL